MGSLTIGFNRKNFIFPCREFKIHDCHLKPGSYVQCKIAKIKPKKNNNFHEKMEKSHIFLSIIVTKIFSFLIPYHFT